MWLYIFVYTYIYIYIYIYNIYIYIYIYVYYRDALKNSGFRDGLTFVESKISEELNDEKRKGKRTVFKKCQDQHW